MSARLSRLALALLALAVVGSVAHAGAMLTWHKMGFTPEIAPREAAFRVAPTVKEPLDIAPILALAPFGTRIISDVPEPVEDTAAAPAVSILQGLSLQGVMVAIPSDRSLAIIDTGSGEISTYAVGQEVQRGATLKEVRSESVDIALGSYVETLVFDDKSRKSTSPGVFIPQIVLPGTQRGATGPRAASTPEEVIDVYRKRIAINPKAVLDGFGVSVTDGGYEIGPTPSIGVTRAGLRPGDIIARVNGEQVGNIEADRRLYEKIAASGQARVEILRNGRRVILSFPLR